VTNQKYPEKIISETIFFVISKKTKKLKKFFKVKESFALYEKDCKIRGKEILFFVYKYYSAHFLA
jgi:hypothetical protein